MADVIFLVLIFIGLVAFEVPGMVRSKESGELWAFLFLLTLGAIFSFLLAFDVQLPNPNQWIIDLCRRIFPF